MGEALETGAASKRSLQSSPRSSSGDDRPSVGDIVEDLGFGFAQIRAILIGGGTYLADGAELLLISSVAKAVSRDWDLPALARGMLVTVVFLGILTGNILSGVLSEAIGRRAVITWSYLGLFVFSIASSFAAGVKSLGAARLLVGTFIGLGQPAWNSIGAEIMPSAWRAFAPAGVFILFSCGELYSASLLLADDPSLLDLHWRGLLRWGAIPGGILAVSALLFLNESPAYLALRGRREEATEVLEAMRRENRAPDVSVDFREPRQSSANSSEGRTMSSIVSRQWQIVFGNRLFGTTLIIMYSCFVLNFAYYGCMYSFPQVLAEVLAYRSAASQLLIGALWEIPGNAMGFLIGFTLPRKLGMKVYLLSQALFMASFITGARAVSHGSNNVFMEMSLYVGYYGIKTMGSAGFCVVYTYSSEVYPTEARATGSAVNIAGGRAGSMLAPLVFEVLTDATGSFHAFFITMIVLSLANCFLIDMLRFETANMRLCDSDEHSEDEAAVAAFDDAKVADAGGAKAYGAVTLSHSSESPA
mmetsp:Transcript_118260/g.331215  ORF Transcript_118260/g.331215 Transcript_118260/m.331215 type:complete len:531 (+) Transcript_118260:178-1770(+)